jgi:serine phosphatase RsbU (regulator of sigma subunit)
MSVADAGAQGPTEESANPDRGPRGRPTGWAFGPVAVVLVVGLAATGVITWVSDSSYMHNEQRLLRLRARDVGAVLTSALPTIQTPLASAAALADATNGNVRKFSRLVAPYVGKQSTGRPFVSVSLWRVRHPRRGPLAVVGARPALASARQRSSVFIKRAATARTLSVLAESDQGRLGYAFTGAVPGPFAAYGESALSPDRYSPPQRNSAFADLDFALYLGRVTNRAHLLLASQRRLPLIGRQTTVHVPFGDRSFTVTVAARQPLAGSLPLRLPWIIAIVGTLLTLAAGAFAARLIERRRSVERLADQLEQTAEENRQLYAEQRTIAQTLQHALLPETLPQFPGLEVSARYEAGVEGVDIGGDWYDLISLADDRLLLVVGDVSGKGLRAATTMALLRFAIRAYSVQGDDPSKFLPKLSRLVNVRADGQLATVMCATIDVPGHEMKITNAGHLPLLTISGEGTKFIESQVGVPVGVDPDATYASTTYHTAPGTTLLAFTDGLVERRGESIEVGLERLRTRAASNHVVLEQLVARLLEEMREDVFDDTAIAAIRWTN